MLTLVLRRIANMLLLMLALSLVLFLALDLNPDSVARKVLGPYSNEEQRAIWLEENGYYDPIPIRYSRWISKAVVGDFGRSVVFQDEAITVVGRRLERTAYLAALVMGIVAPLGILFGVLAGMREGGLRDRSISIGSIVTTSIPEFASAPLLLVVFVFWLGWLPGVSSMASGWSWREIILPVLVLVLYDVGYIVRITRASMIDVMQSHYIRTAVLKGLPRRTVIIRHALRNALLTPFTVIMLQFNWLLSGVIVVEYFFAYRGFGALLLEGALNQDIYIIQACAMVAVFVAVATQTIGDLGYILLNPRIRFSGNN
ncbi:MAG: ABC transporter permease [Alphaproteobacteria bacterium]|nr:ABC transporter permease [Alphaproteobacteria bacterium]MDA7983158.1 ABC transporter permease [Alphaproteobacteria bacterium]MDA7987478.1 ABC transporter permease [Alphaproteobacteria bacterium]MDA7988806.1 ABC transporter permease [Alphaproteobacteria bacterium]MDA8001137.1 ABC transporter permease [Alphaproteobacteria bacterium]